MPLKYEIVFEKETPVKRIEISSSDPKDHYLGRKISSLQRQVAELRLENEKLREKKLRRGSLSSMDTETMGRPHRERRINFA